MRANTQATLSPTMLVNEIWRKLVDAFHGPELSIDTALHKPLAIMTEITWQKSSQQRSNTGKQ